jgi:hypothetical protein
VEDDGEESHGEVVGDVFPAGAWIPVPIHAGLDIPRGQTHGAPLNPEISLKISRRYLPTHNPSGMVIPFILFNFYIFYDLLTRVIPSIHSAFMLKVFFCT